MAVISINTYDLCIKEVDTKYGKSLVLGFKDPFNEDRIQEFMSLGVKQVVERQEEQEE